MARKKWKKGSVYMVKFYDHSEITSDNDKTHTPFYVGKLIRESKISIVLSAWFYPEDQKDYETVHNTDQVEIIKKTIIRSKKLM